MSIFDFMLLGIKVYFAFLAFALMKTLFDELTKVLLRLLPAKKNEEESE